MYLITWNLQLVSEVGAFVWDWTLSWWDLMLIQGDRVRTEMNCRTPSWWQRTAWCVEDPHLRCQKCCECGSSVGVKEKHTGMFFLFRGQMYFTVALSLHMTDTADCWQNPFLRNLDPALESFLFFALEDDYLLNDLHFCWNLFITHVGLICSLHRRTDAKCCSRNWLDVH